MTKNSNIKYLKKLSARQLEEFCAYWNSGPVHDGSELKARGIKAGSSPQYQEGLYDRHELSDGWSLYDHKYDNLVILSDEDDIVRLKGNGSGVVGLMLNIVNTQKTLKKVPEREYGLVLSGGGAKGAFEIGVWRWLERTGLIRKITGISGTSVGALNSVLFACTTLEEAEEIWRSVQQDDLTHINKETVKKMAVVLTQTIVMTPVRPVSLPMVLKDLLPLLGESFFTQEKLSEIADGVLEKGIPEDRIVFSCVARQSLQVQMEPPPELILGTFHNADYYCLNNMKKDRIKEYVLASSALPGVYDPVTIHQFQYRDGGCRDNTPYMPLAKCGFKKLIVVHPSGRKKNAPTVEMAGNSILFHVYPTIHAKTIIDTIRVDKQMTEDWINDGEQSATEQLGPLFKNGDLVIPENIVKQAYENSEEKEMNIFDYENFDYNEEFRKVQEGVSKPNILICGATGIGKSTLIRDIFQLSDIDGPEIGDKGRARTAGVHAYSPEGASITLYDSQGYNIGADEQKYVKDVLGVIGEHFNQNPGEMHEHIHEVWYCVSAANNRFFEADEKMIREIRKKYTTPVMIILTKVDCVDEESIGYLKKAILDKIPDIDIFTYACDAKTADWDDETRAEYVQKNEIIDWALRHLDESLKAGFIPSIKKSLEMKRKYIAGKVIPKYAALAAGAVVTTSVINVPFTDSVPLMALQLKMSYEIIKGYGIKTETQKLAADLLGTSAVTVLGRTLAGSLIKAIPIAGNVFNATVNTTVAATVTAVLGFAVSIVCEQYLAACVDNNGAENLPFTQFMNSARLKEAVKYVTEHKNEFNIQDLLTQIIKSGETTQIPEKEPEV